MASEPTNSVNSGLAIDTKGVDALRRSARDKSPEALKEASKQFEALFLNMMMKSMRQAAPQDGMMDNEQTRMYTSMLDQQLTQNLSKRGVGLADMLVKQLSSTMGKQGMPDDAGTDGSSALEQLSRTHGQKNPWASAVAPSSSNNAGAVGAASAGSNSKQPEHVRAFQDRLSSAAEEASQTTGIPAKFMLGQAALESGWGKHEIRAADGSASHNLFGIKATGGWKGKTVDAVTTEYVNGVPQKRVEKFRAYDSYADAFRDYAALLKNNPRYQNVLANAKDAHSFASGLQRAGYATDPNYATKLATIINKNLTV